VAVRSGHRNTTVGQEGSALLIIQRNEKLPGIKYDLNNKIRRFIFQTQQSGTLREKEKEEEMKKLTLSMVMILACAVLSVGAYGETLTGNLNVSVNAVPACTMSVTGIAFPDFSGVPVTANGDVTVTCAATLPYNIALDAGLHAAGGARLLISATANFINYTLYKDGGFTQTWGDADFGNTIRMGQVLPMQAPA
jgi:spore coat protein U-like protein